MENQRNTSEGEGGVGLGGLEGVSHFARLKVSKCAVIASR